MPLGHHEKIPFARPDLGIAEEEAVLRVLRSGWLTGGPEVKSFEDEFAAHVQAGQAIALSSCTAALLLALRLMDLNKTDAVLVPAITFVATAGAVIEAGAVPVLVDVDPESWLMTPHTLLEFLDKHTLCKTRILKHKKSGLTIRGMIPVHLGGRPCDLIGLAQIAKDYDLFIIDDAAHAFPAAIGQAPIGSDALPVRATAFSFYATKNITTAEGGMLTLSNQSDAERVRRLRLHGIEGQTYGRARWNYDVLEPGYKSNMNDIAAALGRVQLGRADAMHARRHIIHNQYQTAFEEISGIKMNPASLFNSAYHLYTLHLESMERRDKFVEMMFAAEIQTSLHFIPLYRLHFWQKLWPDDVHTPYANFAGAEQAFLGMVSLPLHSSLSDAQVLRVIGQTIRILNLMQ